MADPADAPTSLSTLTVWPPPPTSTPETFTVEGVTVTRDGERLTVHDSKVKKGVIGSSLVVFFIFGYGWWTSIQGWLDFHRLHGTPGPAWADPFFLHKFLSLILTYLAMALIFTGIKWHTYARTLHGGTTVFSRQTKSLQAGKLLGVVKTIDVRRPSAWTNQHYSVTFLTWGAEKTAVQWRRSAFHFRQRENAARLAMELRDFLDVPVEWPDGMG